MITMSLGENDVDPRDAAARAAHARALRRGRHEPRRAHHVRGVRAVVQEAADVLAKMTRSEAMWIAPNEDLLAWLDARTGRQPLASRRRRTASCRRSSCRRGSSRTSRVFAHALRDDGARPRADPAAAARARARRCIDFNGALILVPVMRRLLTWVRATFLGACSRSTTRSRSIASSGTRSSCSRSRTPRAFVAAIARGHARRSWRALLCTRAALTGVVLLVVFAVMWVFSLSFIRRSSRFELFYFTHLLYVAWFVARDRPRAVASSFWAGVPLVGFVVEQVLRRVRRAPSDRRSSTAQALRSGVTRLELEPPAGFDFAPGDYVFLRIPAIARHEWHPFTISSAPESDTLTFHVRSLGNWTAALRRHRRERRARRASPRTSTGRTARRARTSSSRGSPCSSAPASA